MFTYFTINEKIQIVKWYFGGNTIQNVFDLCIYHYGYPSCNATVRAVVQHFEKNGCIQYNCRTCKSPSLDPKREDEKELNEILICAAAELELSARHISIELDFPRYKVNSILRKYGYNKKTNNDKKNEDDAEVLEYSQEKRQIIKWYSKNNSMVGMLKLFIETFKHLTISKMQIINVITQFEMHGCIRDCHRCLGSVNEEMRNLTTTKMEELIKQSNECELLNRKDKSNSSSPQRHKRIKLDDFEETPAVVTNIKSKDENFDNSMYTSPQANIEFVSITSTT